MNRTKRVLDRIIETDWSKSVLGPRDSWPPRLEFALEICLSSPSPISIKWGSELVLLYNDAYSELMGVKHPWGLGKPVLEVWPEAEPALAESYRRILSGERVEMMPDTPVFISRYGKMETAYFNFSHSPLRDERGVIQGIFSILYETSGPMRERIQAQHSVSNLRSVVSERDEEIERSRVFLNSLIENLPNMVFVKDARDLRFVRINRAGEELLGATREVLIGKNDFDLFPRAQAEHFIAKDREVLESGVGASVPEEVIYSRTQGFRVLHTKKIPLFGSDGKPEYLLGISDDITERKRAEEERLKMYLEQAALQERENANRKAALLADASVILASSLDYRASLKRLVEVLVPDLADWCSIEIATGKSKLRPVAWSHRDSARGEDLKELLQVWRIPTCETTGLKAQLYGRIEEKDLRVWLRDEAKIDLFRRVGLRSCVVVPVPGRERVHGVLSLALSESERNYGVDDLRMAEELGRRMGLAIDNALLYDAAQEAIQARDTFLSIASHELKTPLTSLKIQSQLRARTLRKNGAEAFTDERLQRMLKDDERQINRLTRLIDDMLDISRIRSGKLSINPETVDLCALVKEVLGRLSEHLKAADCEVKLNLCEHSQGRWDRFRLEQVITNLITNAMKYGAERPIEIHVRNEGENARLEVLDQGIGIEKKDQRRIFEQFERAVPASGVTGLGLGLFIVRQVVELHQGRVWVESEAGTGSKFIVELPLAPKLSTAGVS